MLLTTFRGDGTPAASPVWFVTDHGEVRLWTDTSSRKVKRVQRDARCTIAPCTFSGKVVGEPLSAEARILAPDDGPRIQAMLRAKYPLQKRAVDAYTRLRRRGHAAPSGASTYLAISSIR